MSNIESRMLSQILAELREQTRLLRHLLACCCKHKQAPTQLKINLP